MHAHVVVHWLRESIAFNIICFFIAVYNTRFPYDTIPTCGNLETLTDIQRYKYSGERMFVSFATNGEEESGGSSVV